jgi:cyclophilin family peptidyl-prolyl cis-trans isomerase
MLKKFALFATALLGVFGFAAGADKAAPKPEQNPVSEPIQVIMKTTMGDITLELYPDKAPIGVKNFLQYVDEGFYSGTIFHRVINNFMIQGGGFNKDLTEKKTKDPIKNEAGNGLKNDRGTIAYARTMIVDSATCQFFINTKDNVQLDHRDETPRGFGYAVFGKVVKGMDVVDKIQITPTSTRNGMGDVPVTTVEIKSVERLKK